MQEKDAVNSVRRIAVDDAQKLEHLEKEKALHEKLQGKNVANLNQAELLELVLLLARQARLVDEQGKVV